MTTKKLIEVALPLEKINAESAREKSIRHGHPSTLHLWWARRPLAAARAVIWSSLVDDPSSHPEMFPTEEDQNKERQRLFKILEELVVWENSNNQEVLNTAKEEIRKSTGGNLPVFLDPFSGGGAIPLEAQRLGLKVYAHDLNPVAVMINKAMIEIPPKFFDLSPVNVDDRISRASSTWVGTEGLAADLQFYASALKKIVFEKIGDAYPKVSIPKEQGGGKGTVAAWLWARTIKCDNPLCGKRAPLIKSTVISKKLHKGIRVSADDGGKNIYLVTDDKEIKCEGTVNRKGAICIHCGAPISFAKIREASKNVGLKPELMAVVVEGNNRRLYLSPDKEQVDAAVINVPRLDDELELAYYPGYVNPVAYGITKITDLFSDRQLQSINTFAEEIASIKETIYKDAVASGMKNDHIPLAEQGEGATAYSEAIAIYLAFIIDKLADRSSNLCGWDASRDGMRNTFGLTGMPMAWDYAEANPFSNSSGCFDNMVNWVCKCILNSPRADQPGSAAQFDAQVSSGLKEIMVSTDPPYYSNVPYADFSDFFYIWMRKSLKGIYPSLFGTMQTPKTAELVADPYRLGGREEAAKHFENGMLKACQAIYDCSRGDIPVTIYYAFKQKDDTDADSKQETSTGWEKMLSAIIEAGFSITGTWPMRTELANRARSLGANALASSIVLVCRKREDNSQQTTRRNLVNALRRELRPALKKLQESNIAPVDLAQSAIGPGMGVFSRYRRVLEADGSPMSVRSALQVINEEVDLYFNEQVGDLDAMSRFCVDLYTQNAFNNIKFGDADVLARAKGTAVDTLASHDVVYAKAGTVHLIERTELPEKIDNNESCIWLLTQQLTQAMATGGVEACAKAVFMMFGSNAEKAKDLAYRLYTIAEQKKWANEAFAYNALVVAWPDIQSRAAMMQRETPEQLDMFSMGLLNT